MKHRKRSPARPRQPHRLPAPQELLRQPEPGFYRLPDLEIRAGRITTDGCRRVLDFSPEKITLDLGGVLVTFYGAALQIESLSGRRLSVAGRVARIEFFAKWEVDPNAPTF